MSRSLAMLGLAASILLGLGCSKREKTDPNAKEWVDVQAMADNAPVVPSSNEPRSEAVAVNTDNQAEDEFGELTSRLKAMKAAERQSGQTLLTGKAVVFDYESHFVRMDGDVKVADDQGQLESEHLTGRFSVSNQLEHIEAEGHVSIVSGERKAKADSANYNYSSGLVQLEGQASVADDGNKLEAERIQFWTKGDRKLICEPNARLEVSGNAATGISGLPEGGETQMRANKIVYDESKRRVDLFGDVKLRDARGAMNCDEVHLYLKDDNKIDWIEALSEVIIQSDDRKALADRATYQADEGKFTLEGSPKVMQGRNVMTGDRIIFWTETRRVVCEPNARVLLYLDEATKAKFLKDLND